MSRTLAVGQKAPEFQLSDQEGEPVKLAEFRGKKVVLYFYPKDDTSGCTLEAIDFTRSIDALKEAGATVIGISGGDEKSDQQRP